MYVGVCFDLMKVGHLNNNTEFPIFPVRKNKQPKLNNAANIVVKMQLVPCNNLT